MANPPGSRSPNDTLPPVTTSVPSVRPQKASIDPGIDRAQTGDLFIGDPDGTLVVELESDGRLRAAREKTRAIVRERLQKAEIYKTGKGWAVLRSLGASARASTRAEAESEREVVLTGALGESGVPLIDLIGFLASGLQTGILRVASGEDVRSIYLSKGDVVWAESSASDDQLGELLVRRGKVTRKQLAEVSRKSGTGIGSACVEHGLIAAHDLWSMVQVHLTEVFDKVLAAETGVWTFARVSEEELAASPVHMPTQRLLMDSLRKVDEMRLYREVIPSSEAPIRRLEQEPEAGLEQAAKNILEIMPATCTVQELMRRTGKSEYAITRIVHVLHRMKLVEVLPDTGVHGTRRGTPISRTDVHDVVVIYSMAIREMVDELSRKGKADQIPEVARGFVEDPQANHPDPLRAVRVLPDGNLDEAALLLALEAHPLSIQDLCDALDELLFFLLFHATELLGRRRRDDLARRVKMIHAMLSAADGAPRPAGTT